MKNHPLGRAGIDGTRMLWPLVLALFVLFGFAGHSLADGATTRIVVIETAASDTQLLRGLLLENQTKSDAMEGLLKKPNVKTIVDVADLDPWPSQLASIDKNTGKIALGGDMEMKLETSLSLSSGEGKLGRIEHLNAAVRLGGKGLKRYQYLDWTGNSAYLSPMHWQERAFWADRDRCVMIWQFTNVNEAQKAKEDNHLDSENLRMEVRLLQAASGDIDKLGQSKVETREKALHWLTGRARSWKEGGCLVMADHEIGWMDLERKVSRPDPAVEEIAEEETGLIAKGKASVVGERLELKLELNEVFGRDQAMVSEIKSSLVPGVWEFCAIEGLKGANIAAIRLSRE